MTANRDDRQTLVIEKQRDKERIKKVRDKRYNSSKVQSELMREVYSILGL